MMISLLEEAKFRRHDFNFFKCTYISTIPAILSRPGTPSQDCQPVVVNWWNQPSA